MNAIDLAMPQEIEDAVKRADTDPDIHVMILSGAGAGFCAGYDLNVFAAEKGSNLGFQDMPWDPIKDYTFIHLYVAKYAAFHVSLAGYEACHL